MNDQRMAPHNGEAERAVLGAVLMNGALFSVAAEILRPDDFFLSSNVKIFRGMAKVQTPGAIDLITLAGAIHPDGKLGEVGGKGYLTSLIDGLPRYDEKAVQHYSELVKDCSMRREAIRQATAIINKAYSGEEEAEQLIIQGARKIECIADGGVDRDEIGDPTIIWDGVHQKETSDEKLTRHVATGMPFDMNLGDGALAPGELMVIAGTPGQGKTTVALNIACWAAVHQQRRILIESFEMTKEELINKLIMIRHGLPKRDTTAAARSEFYWRYSEGLDEKLYISAPEDSDFDRMVNRIRRHHRKHDLNMVIVDHLHLLDLAGNFYSQDLKIGTITRRLKMLAKELNLPIILLSQLSRDSRKEKRSPQLHDLRDSGRIEQDANHIVFLHSATLADAGAKRPAELDDYRMYLAKCRNGRLGSWAMRYVLVNQRIGWELMPEWDFRSEEPTKLIDMAEGEQPDLLQEDVL